MSANKDCDDRLSGIGCGVTCPALLRGECDDPPVEDLVEEIKLQAAEITALTAELATARAERLEARAALACIPSCFFAEKRDTD